MAAVAAAKEVREGLEAREVRLEAWGVAAMGVVAMAAARVVVVREAGGRPVAEAAEVAMAAVEGAAVVGAERAGEAMVEAGLTAEEGRLAASAAVATVGEAAAGAPCAGPG